MSCTGSLIIATLVLYYTGKDPCISHTPTLGRTDKLHWRSDSCTNCGFYARIYGDMDPLRRSSCILSSPVTVGRGMVTFTELTVSLS